jgi:hypothetical protein
VVPLGYWHARLLRHGPRAVLSCAGAYVSGAAGSNACPAGSVRIEAEDACRTAAAAAGKTFDRVETNSIWPRGCYYRTIANDGWFNTHAVGAGRSDSQLLCALATAGAPLKRRRRTDARSARTGARVLRAVPRGTRQRCAKYMAGTYRLAYGWPHIYKQVFIHVY